MDAVIHKLQADLTSRPLLSMLIIATTLAASMLLTLALATLINIGAPYDRSFEELNAAHLWLHLNRDRVSLRDINRIESLPGVAESTGLQYSILSRVRLRNTRAWTSLRATPVDTPAINRLLVQEGRYLARDEREVLASTDLNYYY